MTEGQSAAERATEFLERGVYGSAAEAFEQAAAETEPSAAILVPWAEALMGDRRPDLAIEKLEQAISLDAMDRKAYLVEAHIRLELRESDAALLMFERASAVLTDDPELYVAWGQVLAGLQMFEQARWRFDRAIALDDQCVLAYLGAGQVLLAMKLAEDAADRFQHVGETLAPDSGRAFGGWGEACFQVEDYETALAKFTRASELDADNPASINHSVAIGETHLELSQFSEALNAFGHAMMLETKFPATGSHQYRARFGAARVALVLNSPEESLAYCEEGLHILTNPGPADSLQAAALHYVAGAARSGLKLYKDAISSFRSASARSGLFAVYALNAIASVLAAQGKYEEAWSEIRGLETAWMAVQATQSGTGAFRQRLARGTAQLWLNEFDEAEQSFESALGPHRRNASAWAKLAELYLERRDQSLERASHWQWEAYEAYRKAIPLLEKRPEEPRDFDSLVGLAQLHFRMDEFDKAEELFSQAAALRKASSVPFAGLGMLLAKRRRFAAAVDQFLLALAREPDDIAVRCHLADAYAHLCRHDLALDAYSDVVRIAPGNVGAHIGMGEVLTAQAEATTDERLYEDAEVHFTKAVELASSVRSGQGQKGSSDLSVRLWAALYYSRGYVRVKIYESRTSDLIGRPSIAIRRRLEGALADFEEAAATKVHAHKAERAAEKVRERLKRFSSTGLTDSYAPLVVALSSMLVLITVQIAFFVSGGFSQGKNSAAYSTLTLSLLALIAAGFYLPQVLKFKLGGIELEKATTQINAGTTLNLQHDPIQAGLHTTFSIEVAGDLKTERDEERAGSLAEKDARRGRVRTP
jgi:tetratricopeptide (TPR) repeat protein